MHSFFAEDPKHIHLWAVVNMFEGEAWIFAAPDPAVVGIDFTTDKKCSLITENCGAEKFHISDETFAYRISYEPLYLHL
jgi:hypothetical protein